MYYDVNVFTDMSNIVSIIYYAFMSVYIPFTRAVVSELCIPTVHCMEGDPATQIPFSQLFPLFRHFYEQVHSLAITTVDSHVAFGEHVYTSE